MALEIALRVYDGGLTTGFDQRPIVSVGVAPTGFVPMPPTLVDEEKVWMISHAQSHTMYAWYSRDCRTAEGAPGQLLICLFFPAMRRLADEKSPFGLLNSLSDMFAVQAMSNDVLPQTAVESSVFVALLKRYRLEDRPMPLPIMEGSEPAAFCVANMSQLDALMRHSRYPALAKVGLLELGQHCATTIQIPVNGSKPQPPQQNVAKQEVRPQQEVQSHIYHEQPKPLQERPKPRQEQSHLQQEQLTPRQEQLVVKSRKSFSNYRMVIFLVCMVIFGLSLFFMNRQCTPKDDGKPQPIQRSLTTQLKRHSGLLILFGRLKK